MLKSGGKYYISVGLAILLIAGCAEKPATIKGSVKDEDGKPLAGAAVFSVPQRYSTLTDTLGNFSIEGVESGQYSLMAKMGEDATKAVILEMRHINDALEKVRPKKAADLVKYKTFKDDHAYM